MSTRINRPPAVAGSFYLADARGLRREIETFLARAGCPEPELPPPAGLIAPHAGYLYSGAIAARAYRLLAGHDYDLVVVVSPSHHCAFSGFSLYQPGNYETPLGEVRVDCELVERLLAEHPDFNFVAAAHRSEHALEVQLPFLQVVLGDFTLLPVVMGRQSFQSAARLAEVLAGLARERRLLIVASSDLSHFHPAAQARNLDQRIVDVVAAGDPEGLWHLIESGRAEACGAGPMLALMLALKKLGSYQSRVLEYRHSGEVCGDHSRVVGYLAAAFYSVEEKTGRKNEEETVATEPQTKIDNPDFGLSPEDKNYLRTQVAAVIEARLAGRAEPDDVPDSPVLREKRGGFVTLKKNGALRGCIGYIEAYKPLYQTVREMARAAAFNDPRFPPLRAAEWPAVTVEISVLTPLQRISDPGFIEVGKHGILLRNGPSSGLLLPQVAVEYSWEREEFLNHTCLKAGLRGDCWRHPETEIFIFSAEIF
jgi:AmmeMemoRadiSam system protein B/AmmeMemoRadiSam system protein A